MMTICMQSDFFIIITEAHVTQQISTHPSKNNNMITPLKLRGGKSKER